MLPKSSRHGLSVRGFRPLQVESLENRLYLSSGAIGPAPMLDPTDAYAASISLVSNSGSGGSYTANDNGAAASSTGNYSRAVDAINQFALELYQHFQKQHGNLFLSPMSISTALAMTYLGARGETASQMAEALGFGSAPGIEESFRALLTSLNPGNGDSRYYELNAANALWPQQGYPFYEEYLNTIKSEFGGDSWPLDYITGVEQSRQIINDWIAEKTHDKIKDLLPQGALTAATKLVLTNAIYFKGQWATQFDPQRTKDGLFYLDSGKSIDVSMMHLTSEFRYRELDGYQVLDMPYQGNELSMVIMLPRSQSGLVDIDADTLGKVNEWLKTSSEQRDVVLSLPKFKMTVSSSLSDVLESMGMTLAFNAGAADFSGMAPLDAGSRLFIGKVLHKAFVEVNEEGTEAAAATAVVVCGCFAAGTPVLTPEGAKPIEEIKPGDMVLSRSEFDCDGPVMPKRVEECFVRNGATFELRVAGQTIRVTAEHPFYVQKRGWIAAGELRPDDLLACADGIWRKVEKITVTGDLQTVYNFRVADSHTYFIGGDVWGFGVWVHNFYCAPTQPAVTFTADHAFHFFIRDNKTGAILFMGRMADPSQMENSITPTGETVKTEKKPETVEEPVPPVEITDVFVPPITIPVPNDSLPDIPPKTSEPPASNPVSPEETYGPNVLASESPVSSPASALEKGLEPILDTTISSNQLASPILSIIVANPLAAKPETWIFKDLIHAEVGGNAMAHIASANQCGDLGSANTLFASSSDNFESNGPSESVSRIVFDEIASSPAIDRDSIDFLKSVGVGAIPSLSEKYSLTRHFIGDKKHRAGDALFADDFDNWLFIEEEEIDHLLPLSGT